MIAIISRPVETQARWPPHRDVDRGIAARLYVNDNATWTDDWQERKLGGFPHRDRGIYFKARSPRLRRTFPYLITCSRKCLCGLRPGLHPSTPPPAHHLKVMTIRLARDLSFSPPPRCPTCGVGLLPYSKDEPFVVDAEGRLYCREDGERVDPAYPQVRDEYMRTTRARRAEAFRVLEEEPVA